LPADTTTNSKYEKYILVYSWILTSMYTIVSYSTKFARDVALVDVPNVILITFLASVSLFRLYIVSRIPDAVHDASDKVHFCVKAITISRRCPWHSCDANDVLVFFSLMWIWLFLLEMLSSRAWIKMHLLDAAWRKWKGLLINHHGLQHPLSLMSTSKWRFIRYYYWWNISKRK